MAARATPSNVIGVPLAASSRSARMALDRVSSWRCRAAAMMAALLSGRSRCVLIAGLAPERCDDLFEVPGDLPVHLGQPVLAAGFGGGDDLQDLVVMLAVPGQEFGGCDEDRAGQARVGVRQVLTTGRPQ